MRTVTPTGMGPRHSARVSREELAVARPIWIAHGATMAFVAASTFVLAFAIPAMSLGAMLAFAGLLAVIGVVILAAPPAAIGTVENHLALISLYAPIGIGELAFAPDWKVPLGASMFTGTLAATRLTDRREIVAHLMAATACWSLPAVALAHHADEIVGLVAVIIAVWALCGITTYLLEGAEAQGRELEVLLRRDPLTGVGNQRLLDERLVAELDRHAGRRAPLSLIAIDLTEFSDLNELFGRTACDELLGQAAAAISGVLGDGATIARPIDDEFWIVLPAADRLASNDAVAEIRWALANVALPTQETGLAAAVGVATYPSDAVHAGVLVELARERMVDDRESGHYVPPPLSPTARSRSAGATVEAPPLVRGISRAQFAEHPMVWLSVAIGFGVVAAFVAATFALAPSDHRPLALLGALLVCAAIGFVGGRPALGSIRNHVFIGSVSCTAALGFWALQPDPGVAMAVAVFVGPAIAVRMQTRSEVAGHIAAACVVFSLVGAAGISTGGLLRPTILQLALLVPVTVSLGWSCMIGLELAEEQGRELELLVRTDPVTGVGNRHMLGERLAEEIASHQQTDAPLSLVLIELVETFENSRAASELLLQSAAETIKAALGPGDAVIRRRGHEFVLILQDAEASGVSHTVSAVNASLADLARRGHRMETIHVMSSYPEDGDTADALLSAADARLMSARLIAGFDHTLENS